MKTIKTYALLSLLVIGCYQKNLGPKSDITSNGTGGYWKLSSYLVNGKAVQITEVPDYFYLKAEVQTVLADSSYPSTMYRVGTDYRLFSYYDNPGKKSFSRIAIPWTNDYSHKKKQDTFWYRIDDNSGFALTLNVNVAIGESSKLQISNVMQSATNKSELDSIRYIYEPVSPF